MKSSEFISILFWILYSKRILLNNFVALAGFSEDYFYFAGNFVDFLYIAKW